MEEVKALSGWYEKAGVRGGARRMVDEDGGELDKAFFPEHLVPHLMHPVVQSLDDSARRHLNAQHLFQWLTFTTHFEVDVVNRATLRIADGRSGVDLSPANRMNAFKIYIDEGYHSLYNLDLRDQLERVSGIAALPYDFRRFLARLDAIGDDHPDHAMLIQLLQVVVFETLITTIFADVPGDTGTMRVVRDLVRDHAIDEGRHHAFFVSFFTHLWGRLDGSTRRLVTALLPRLITRSLQPPTEPAMAALRNVGLSADLARAVVADSYNRDAVTAGIRLSAAKTIRLFEEHGLMDLPGGREGFSAEGLLTD